MLRFPARTLVRFFANHHLLSASGQPQWYTVTGGAQEYVEPPDRALCPSHPHRLRRGRRSRATDGKVQVRDTRGETENL